MGKEVDFYINVTLTDYPPDGNYVSALERHFFCAVIDFVTIFRTIKFALKSLAYQSIWKSMLKFKNPAHASKNLIQMMKMGASNVQAMVICTVACANVMRVGKF